MAREDAYAEKRDRRGDRRRSRSASGSPQPLRQRPRLDSRERPRERSDDNRPSSYGETSLNSSNSRHGTDLKRKRPGQGARLTQAQKDSAAAAARKREEEHEARQRELLEQSQRERHGIHQAVREHYNQVPERGRDWRRTQSRIKGLREYNNWVKSCLIQKFSASDDTAPGAGDEGADGYDNHRHRAELHVLDIGCGKGGDLFKWQKAPQRVGLYIGIDPAEISIQQARARYEDAKRKARGRRIFHAEFYARDGFGEWVGELPLIQKVGIDPNVGPGGNPRWGGGGFDVVTMMFCMHYALESQDRARGMLRNVAGALKKGGRFFGVIPSSDVIRDNIERFYKDWEKKRAGKRKASDASKPAKGVDPDKDGEEVPGSPTFMPESPTFAPDSPVFARSSPGAEEGEANGHSSKQEGEERQHQDGPEKDSTAATDEELAAGGEPEPQWGNSLYNVRFPRNTPKDGIFRPPFGWKYSYFLAEAVEAPEYIVPFEAFRALAEEYSLEMTYKKPFLEVYEDEKDDRYLGTLGQRMGVMDFPGGPMKMTAEEKEAASFYLAFCFVKM